MPFLYGSKAHDSSEPPLSIVKEQLPPAAFMEAAGREYCKDYALIT